MKLLRRARVFLRAHRNGQSLIEVLVALAIGVAFIVAAASIIAPALTVNKQAGQLQTVAALSQELTDNIRVWKGSGWGNVASLSQGASNHYYLNTSVSPFQAVQGTETVGVGSSTYQRYFYVSPVYRDGPGNITTSATLTYAPIVLVQQNGGTNGSNYCASSGVQTLHCSFAQNVAAGDFVVVAIHHSVNDTVSSVTGGTDTFSPVSPADPCPDTTGGDRGDIYYAKNSAGGYEQITVNLNTTATSGFRIMIHEYSGVDQSNPFDQSACGTQGSVTTAADAVTSGNVSTTAANELIFGFAQGDYGPLSTGTNYTQRQTSGGVVTEDRIVSSTGTYAATATDSHNGDDTYALIATFKAASSLTSAGTLDPSTLQVSVVMQPVSFPGGVTSWATTSPLLYTDANLSVFYYNGYAYAIGGNTTGGGLTWNAEYAPINSNGTMGTWTATTQMPNSLYGQTAVLNNNYLYTFGGKDGADGLPTSTVYYGPINSDHSISWSTTTSLSAGGGYTNAAAATNGTYVYVMGGLYYNESGNPTSTVYVAQIQSNGTLGAWSTTTPLPVAMDSGRQAFIYNNYVYFGGGYTTGGGPYSGAPAGYYVYYAPINSNGTLGAWASSTTPDPIYPEAIVLGDGGYLYTAGQTDDNFTSGTSTVTFAQINSNGSLGSWQQTQSTPSTGVAWNSSFLMVNDVLYSVGGDQIPIQNNITSTVYYAALSKVSNGSQNSSSFYLTRNSNNALNYSNWVGGPTVQGTGAWSVTSPLSTGVYNANAVAYNGYLYVPGGQATGGAGTNAVQYAPINSNGSVGTWQTTTNLPQSQYGNGAFANNGYLYSLGGSTGGVTSTVYYAPINSTGSIGAWSLTTSIPSPSGITLGAALTNGSYAFYVGGKDDTGVATSTVYYAPINSNGTLGSWTRTQSLPATMQYLRGGIVNGDIYIGGGVVGASTILNNIYYTSINSNGTLGAWTTTATNTIMYQGEVGFGNGFVYAMGYSDSGGNNITSTVTYAAINANTTVGAWSTTATFLSKTTENNSMPTSGNYIYSVGGDIAANTATSSVFYAQLGDPLTITSVNSKFSTSTNVNYASTTGAFYLNLTGGSLTPWTLTSPLSTAVDIDQVEANNGYIYAVAGQAGAGESSQVQYAQINSTGSLATWQTTTALPNAVYSNAQFINNGYIYSLGGVTSILTSTVWYAPINSTGSIGAWATSTPLLWPDRNGVAATNGSYVYYLQGAAATTTVSYAQINGGGSLGAWSTTTPLPMSVYLAPIVFNGYLYAGTPSVGGAGQQYMIFSSQINGNGTLGAWTTTYLSSSTLDFNNSFFASGDGFLYDLASTLPVDGTSTVVYAPINADYSIGTFQPTTIFPGINYGLNANAVLGVGNYIYSVGGTTDPNYQVSTSSVYFAQIVTSTLKVATGSLDSTVYDTGVSTGAQLNSVLWQGTQPSNTTVQFQFAVSNSASGPWTFIGSDGLGDTYYTVGPNTSQSLDYSLFNNYRYFKVRTTLTSNSSGTLSPTVNDVIVNWSP